MGALRRVATYLDRRPWLLSLILVIAVAVPGLVRVEQIAHDAQDAADAAQAALEGDCQIANAARVANLQTWASLFDTLEELLGPDNQADVDQLRAGVILLEPTDCDGDGDVDAHDIDRDPPTINP